MHTLFQLKPKMRVSDERYKVVAASCIHTRNIDKAVKCNDSILQSSARNLAGRSIVGVLTMAFTRRRYALFMKEGKDQFVIYPEFHPHPPTVMRLLLAVYRT